MTNDALSIVNNHLSDIARRAFDTAGGIESKRALVDEYLGADPSILQFDAKIHSVSIEQLHGEWVIPQGVDHDCRVLYLHGGSWMAGTVKAYRPHIARIAAVTGCSVLAIDYRLAPEHAFPFGLEDCVTAFEWMGQNGPEQNTKAKNTFIIGDSAGGNLTLACLLVLKDKKIILPDAAVALSPVTDLSWSAESIKYNKNNDVALNAALMPLISSTYLQNKTDAKMPYVSPLFGELNGLPPLLIQVGDTEILLDDAVGFIEKAIAAGVEGEIEVYPNMPHVFQGFAPFLPDAVTAMESIGKFVKRYFL